MDVGGEVDERMDAEETIEATSGSSSMAMEEFFFFDDYASAFFSIMADFTDPGALWFAAFAANIQTAVARYASVDSCCYAGGRNGFVTFSAKPSTNKNDLI